MPSPSKRAGRCPNCDHVERHGVSIFQAQKAKRLEQQRAKPKNTYNIPARSKKGKIKAAEITRVKKLLKSESSDGTFSQCGGCLQYHRRLDASHKIPISQSIARAAEPENIRLLCRSCHEVWEHWKMPALVNLHCFDEDMEYLRANDWERFSKMHLMILEYADRNSSRHLLGVLVRLLDIAKKSPDV
jgi:5-methylcytosine-specific restriction endonuclease McrA